MHGVVGWPCGKATSRLCIFHACSLGPGSVMFIITIISCFTWAVSIDLWSFFYAVPKMCENPAFGWTYRCRSCYDACPFTAGCGFWASHFES